jgi:hypothetical protein
MGVSDQIINLTDITKNKGKVKELIVSQIN